MPVKKAATKKTATKKSAPPKGKEIIQDAKHFTEAMMLMRSDDELKKIQRYFKTAEGDYGAGDSFIGVRMGHVFELAKQYTEMPVKEIEKLLESPIHEMRAGACSIMDKASRKKITDERRKELFDLYIRRHDRINNWDLVDLASLNMTGQYLFDKPRDILYKLVKSKNMWERRTAVLATIYFIRKGQLDDTYKLAEILLKDKEDLVQKAAGWMLRFAGDKDPKRLLAFLDKHAATMPRTMLRNSIEKLGKTQREYYLNLRLG